MDLTLHIFELEKRIYAEFLFALLLVLLLLSLPRRRMMKKVVC